MTPAATQYIEAFKAAFGYEPTLTKGAKGYFIENRVSNGRSPCEYSDRDLRSLTLVMGRLKVQS
jgi:hypothetical protein